MILGITIIFLFCIFSLYVFPPHLFFPISLWFLFLFSSWPGCVVFYILFDIGSRPPCPVILFLRTVEVAFCAPLFIIGGILFSIRCFPFDLVSIWFCSVPELMNLGFRRSHVALPSALGICRVWRFSIPSGYSFSVPAEAAFQSISLSSSLLGFPTLPCWPFWLSEHFPFQRQLQIPATKRMYTLLYKSKE